MQFAQDHLVEERRQARVAQANFAALCVEFETECGFQQRERRRACPGLRRASHRVQRRAAAPFTLKPAEQFGQPPQIHIAGGVEQALEHMFDRMLQSVAREAECDQRIIVRPDRSIVIGHRIVTRLAARDGADAPSRKEFMAHEIAGDHARPIRPRNAGEQQLPGIRRSHLARLFGAVERQRVSSEVVAPESLFEALGQPLRIGFQLSRPIHQAQAERAARCQVLARKHICLNFR